MRHPVVEEILYQFTDDWAALGMVHGLVAAEQDFWFRGPGEPTSDDVRRESLAVVRFMLSHELMRTGEPTNDVDDPDDFRDWPGGVTEILCRIGRDWDSLMPFGCWFRGTKAGVAAGRAIAEAEGRLWSATVTVGRSS